MIPICAHHAYKVPSYKDQNFWPHLPRQPLPHHLVRSHRTTSVQLNIVTSCDGVKRFPKTANYGLISEYTDRAKCPSVDFVPQTLRGTLHRPTKMTPTVAPGTHIRHMLEQAR